MVDPISQTLGARVSGVKASNAQGHHGCVNP